MTTQKETLTIRVWKGNQVRAVVVLGPTGGTFLGATGGADNSTKVDIELDPWRGLIVDHTAEHPIPVFIRGD